MSKGKIITLSIVSFVVLLNILLFGFVFRLRKQEVVVVEGTNISAEEIVASAGLKNGESIFMLDKQSAISNIEKENPNIKVVQIKTTSVTTIQFVVRKRYPIYYYKQGDNYYILDEDLKILNITTIQPEEYIKIDVDIVSNYLTIGNFIGSTEQQTAAYNLFKAMYEAVVTSEGEQARKDIANKIDSFKIGERDRIIITTESGAVLDIENYKDSLTDKINKCFTAIKDMENENRADDLQVAIFKIFYDLQGKEYFRLILPTESED